MTDYPRVVEGIFAVLHAPDRAPADAVRELAGAYVGACREVNDRLRRCEEFLRQGLRTEAVHYAQAEPVLLEAVAALDFAERPQWEDLAHRHGMPPPPPLLLDTAEALNRAYAEEQPLDELLRRHRL